MTGLAARAQAVLRANDTGVFIKPGPRQYPHQWNWDAAVIALGLAHFDLARALAEIRALLRGQWADGMLPHVVYHTGPSDYFPYPDFWQIESSPHAPGVATSGITQPPLLTSVVRWLHERHGLQDFAREVFPKLLRWHRWLHQARDADSRGLVCLIHPWESGTDDSPRWLEAIARIRPVDVPAYRRQDTRHVAGAERPNDADYDRFVHLIDVFRRHNYHPADLLARSPFLVQDVLFNSILQRANEDLRALALALGEPAGEIEAWMRALQAGFDGRLWDEVRGLYWDYDLRADAPLRVNTAMTFAPLFGGLASPRQAQRLVDEHLRNPAEYAPGPGLRYALTTTSRAEPAWEPRRYWRGPVWIIYNWLILQGLRRYGYAGLAQALRDDTLSLIERAGFREYYDPRDGSGCGSTDFSWSAALALELLAEPA
jgi:glycogen debranching enzyme